MDSSDGHRAPGSASGASVKQRLSAIPEFSIAPFIPCPDPDCRVLVKWEHFESLLEEGGISFGQGFRCSALRTARQSKAGHKDHYLIIDEQEGLRCATNTERVNAKGLGNRRAKGISQSRKFARSEIQPSSSGRYMPPDDFGNVTMLAKGDGRSQDPTISLSSGADTVDMALATQTASSDPRLQSDFVEYSKRVQDAIQSQLVLHPYKLQEVVGRGASGVVVRAEHVETGESYAVKFTWGTMIKGPKGNTDRLRVWRSFHIQDLAHCDQIARVHAMLESEFFGYITVEELLRGKDLKTLLDEKGSPFLLAKVKKITLAVCLALEKAHDLGYFHRDIKPANIMEEDNGRNLLVDWGISRWKKDEHRDNRGMLGELADLAGFEGEATADADMIGTPHYMAPEQGDGGRISHLTDIYQLGATLYHLWTNNTVSRRSDHAGILEDAVTRVPLRPTLLLDSTPENLAFGDLIMDMLEKDPRKRPQTVQEVMQRLGESEQQQMPPTRDIKPWVNTILIAAVLIVLVLILLNLKG